MRLSQVTGTLGSAKKGLADAGKAIAAGAAGAAVVAGNMRSLIKNKATEARNALPSVSIKSQNSGEVTMKKSTLIALLVALGVVAGVLGALYVYVLRREKELDEYEQLLFSEDFNDDLPDQMDDLEPEDEEEEKA